MKKGFYSGQLEENNKENAEETHFIINPDNSKTLGISSYTEVRYTDVTSGGEGLTMLLRLSGGRNARIKTPFLIFQNKERIYLIRGLPDNVPEVVYRSGPKGWMDSQNML